MAEVSQNSNMSGQKSAKVRSKKMSTKIDFTPMVDLGFLLITFFMLTTTLTKPNILAVVMPENTPNAPQPPIKASKVLTLLLGANDKVYYYNGIENPKMDSTDYSPNGLRKVIFEKVAQVNKQFGLDEYTDKKTNETKTRSYATILIKATDESRYKNMVDVLDEMAICDIKYYVLMDISEREKEFIKNPTLGLKM